MKLIIPMARISATSSSGFVSPSPLLSLAGRPILLRVLDVVRDLKISEIIFIVDKDDIGLKKLVSDNFDFKVKYVLQRVPMGVAHAIYGARKYVGDSPCMVLFADSILDIKLKSLNNIKEDAVVWTKQVNDPRGLGVVFLHEGFVSKLIEKPETPVSDLALVGLYYFKNSKLLFESISFLIKNKIMTKNSYQLTDALQIMINKGAKIVSKDVNSWFDCGSINTLLLTHKEILNDIKESSKIKDSVVINPVFIDKTAVVKNSVIGPFVSVGKGVVINRSVIKNSIIVDDAVVENAVLDSGFVGRAAKVKGSFKRVVVRDSGVVNE